MRFLTQPHIPDGEAALCAVGAEYSKVASALRELGPDVVELAPNPLVSAPVKSHADMLLHDRGEGRLVIAAGCGNRERLESYGFTVEETPVGGEYPKDVALNCFRLGGILFGLSEAVAPELLNYYQSNRAEVAGVRQGYAKCATAIVDSGSIITADEGIARAAASRAIRVLRIRPGFIELPGFDAGFIGGCCGLLSNSLLVFCGNIGEHPDGERIREFCSNRGVKIHCLTEGPLLDIGGVLPLAVRG